MRSPRISCAGRRALIAISLGLLASTVVGCGSSEDSEPSSSPRFTMPPAEVIEPLSMTHLAPGKADLRAVQWQLVRAPMGRRVVIQSEQGFCSGEPPPKFQAVRVVEEGERVYITPYVQSPRPERDQVCRGIGGFQRGIVELGQGADKARLYDATATPSELRWPSNEGA